MKQHSTILVAVPAIIGGLLTAFDSSIQLWVTTHTTAAGIIVAILSGLLAHLPSATTPPTNG